MSDKETLVENSTAVNKPKAYKGTEPSLFISYAQKDSGIVLPIIEHLQSRGVRLWYDAGIDPAENFRTVIAPKIKECQIFVALFSNNFYQSNWCPKEFDFAFKNQKKILAIVIDDQPVRDDFDLIMSGDLMIRKLQYQNPDDFYSKIMKTAGIDQCISAAPIPRTNTAKQDDSPQADNKEYLNHFKEPLFLEEKNDSKVTLASMYVSPHLNEGGSVAECIMHWYNHTTMERCMLLYGNAGVGKSSLVSKIVADAYNITPDEDREFHFNADQVLAVALRNHSDEIHMTKKSDKILMDLFSGYSKEQLKSKLLILDGLDEVCVLCKGFDGYKFLEKLVQLERGFHVLVTSRAAEGYFSNPQYIKDLQIKTLQWTIPETETWCSKYCKAKEDKRTWSNQFIEEYKCLKENENDHRKGAFCVPIILYICGASEIKLSDHNNIGSIYGDAFRKILLRAHLRGLGDHTDLTEADKKSNLIAWQYTKELAYQMFLLNTLDLADSSDCTNEHAIGLKNAKARTKAVLQEKCGSDFVVLDQELEIKKELALCPFTKGDGAGGITFAHKTVYEYFTAVKLYEDYFAKFDSYYFKKTKPNTKKAAKEVMKAAIAAFRNKSTPKDIFCYLCDMKNVPFSGGERITSDIGLDYKCFEQAYEKAMEARILDTIDIKPPVKEYIYPKLVQENPINTQVIRAFRALTCFLTGHGFQNENGTEASKRVRSFLVLSEQNINIMGWDLSGANLNRANLHTSDLHDVHLKGADLDEADLTSADLSNADLSNVKIAYAHLSYAQFCNANLTEANLRGSNLRGANLTGANLTGANLTDTNLTDANLRGAKYCKDPVHFTRFPDRFDPVAHCMIEVDKYGNPVTHDTGL